jgi:hypothetical protein
MRWWNSAITSSKGITLFDSRKAIRHSFDFISFALANVRS